METHQGNETLVSKARRDRSGQRQAGVSPLCRALWNSIRTSDFFLCGTRSHWGIASRQMIHSDLYFLKITLDTVKWIVVG